jgi:hypothetical protein
MKYIIEIVSNGKTYLPCFKKIDTGVQAILRKFRGCNVGIADGRDYLIMPLRWGQVSLYKDWFRNSKFVRGCTYTHRQQDLISLLLSFPQKQGK